MVKTPRSDNSAFSPVFSCFHILSVVCVFGLFLNFPQMVLPVRFLIQTACHALCFALSFATYASITATAVTFTMSRTELSKSVTAWMEQEQKSRK